MHRLEVGRENSSFGVGRENASFGGRKGKCIIWMYLGRESLTDTFLSVLCLYFCYIVYPKRTNLVVFLSQIIFQLTRLSVWMSICPYRHIA